MTSFTRVTQNDAGVGYAGNVTRVSQLDGGPGLNIATTIRMTQLSAQVALAYVVPRVTQVTAQAAFIASAGPTPTKGYIKVL